MGIRVRNEESLLRLLGLPPFLAGAYANAGWEPAVVEMYFDRARSFSQARLRQQGLL